MRMIPSLKPPLARLLAGLSLVLAWPAQAGETADPDRVGRIVDLKGDVALYDEAYGEWSDAQRNRPLVAGDRLVLQRSARAEVRVGDTVLLLGEGADLAIDTLDGGRLQLTLYDGSLAMRVASRDDAESTEVRTLAAVLRPQRAGRYRVDQDEESTFAGVWRGALEVSGHGHLLLIGAGERHEIWRDQRRGDTARSREARMPQDRFAAWVDDRFDEEDQREARRRDRYPGPEGIPGVDELDGYGRWDSHPEYGAVWLPASVSVGWAPFTDGRWIWMRPWGWTWVDDQPWGFATSHYGRWVNWRGRWAWWPGQRQMRPVFAPAVVAWIGGSHVSVGISIGTAPPSAWAPLAPWQAYVPIVAPRPPKPSHEHGRPPPRRLPPPAEPISRQPGSRAEAPSGFSTQPGRPMAPGSVRYGSDGVSTQVQVAPAAQPAPVAAPRPESPREGRAQRPAPREDEPPRPSRAESPPAPPLSAPMVPMPAPTPQARTPAPDQGRAIQPGARDSTRIETPEAPRQARLSDPAPAPRSDARRSPLPAKVQEPRESRPSRDSRESHESRGTERLK